MLIRIPSLPEHLFHFPTWVYCLFRMLQNELYRMVSPCRHWRTIIVYRSLDRLLTARYDSAKGCFPLPAGSLNTDDLTGSYRQIPIAEQPRSITVMESDILRFKSHEYTSPFHLSVLAFPATYQHMLLLPRDSAVQINNH